ncbi:hypothetical protein SSX86_022067 [Deinandra increscens subsp. villosa]|uniref:DUF3511 domain protein n=1 Tax=Deinandra increscens subsp. villosa TaxID=3103831 RepID=A0AAP0CNL6_9ASTR
MEAAYNRPSNCNFDRRMEIVSGSSKGNHQIYASAAAAGVRSPPRTSTSWSDPESKRKKRIAKYKVYTIEGRVKASFRNGIRWIKSKCSDFIHGF